MPPTCICINLPPTDPVLLIEIFTHETTNQVLVISTNIKLSRVPDRPKLSPSFKTSFYVSDCLTGIYTSMCGQFLDAPAV